MSDGRTKARAKRPPGSNDEQIILQSLKVLQRNYEADNQYKASQYKWLKDCPSGRKGKIAEDLILKWCAAKKLSCEKSADKKNYDLLIEEKRVEVKLSFLWESGIFKFQQIRNGQKYQLCLCLGISPNQIRAWLIPKRELRRDRPCLRGQHRGKKGVDTKWLSFHPDEPPKWIVEYGDDLSAVRKLFKEL